MSPEEFIAWLGQAGARAKEEIPPAMAEHARQFFLAGFDAQGADRGSRPWAPRVPPTGSWPILVRSGNLRASVENSVVEATWEQVRLTSDTDYGEYLNEGTSRMVARPFMEQSDMLDEELAQLVEDKLKDIFD